MKLSNEDYQSWKWLTIEEVFKMEEKLFFGVNKFFRTYKIKKLADIKSLVLN